MIGARDHQFRLGKLVRDLRESFNQNFGTLVRPPLPECQDSMLGVSASAHVRELGRCGENAMLAKVHVLATVGFEQHFAVRRQQDRQRSREQHQLRRNCAKELVQPRESSSLGKVDEFNYMVQSNVRIKTEEPQQKRSTNSQECRDWLIAEARKHQVEPHHVRSVSSGSAQKCKWS